MGAGKHGKRDAGDRQVFEMPVLGANFWEHYGSTLVEFWGDFWVKIGIKGVYPISRQLFAVTRKFE
jgi:hypothetical protein